MAKPRVHVVEVVADPELRKKEARARAVVRRLFPDAGPVRIYRTADGRIGCQLDIAVTAGHRKRMDQVYDAIMKAVGEKRGRHRGVRKDQTKASAFVPPDSGADLQRLSLTANARFRAVLERSRADVRAGKVTPSDELRREFGLKRRGR